MMLFNKLIPELSVEIYANSLNFYTKIIGFKVEYKREKFAFLSLQGSQIMIEEVNHKWNTGKMVHPYGRGINFQIEVKNIDPILTRLRKNHYPLFAETQENWYRMGGLLLGNKEFLVQDPDGYLLRFSEDLGTKPA